jgi:hypothetical protein
MKFHPFPRRGARLGDGGWSNLPQERLIAFASNSSVLLKVPFAEVV